MRPTTTKSGPSKPKRPGKEPLQAIPAEVLLKLAASVSQARSPSDAIKDHLAVAQDLVGARLAFVSSYDSEKHVLAVSAVRGRADETVIAAKPGVGPVGLAFAGRSIVGEPLGHLAVALLEGEDRPYGVLSLVGAKREAAPEVWQAFAAHLMAAVAASQSKDAAVRRTRDLETAVAGLKSLDRARDELLGGVSHELKSPLTTIKAYLAMARKEKLGPLTDRMSHAFEVCDRNADRLLRLINDMLLMARLQGGKMTLSDRPFGLRALVEEVVGQLAALAGAVPVSVTLAKGGEVFVKGDRERLLEAVGHLLENAILYNKKRGEVRVRVRAESGTAVIELTDTGHGIDSADLPLVFDRFYRGRGAQRAGGSGLGLAIVRQVAQLHGGSAVASSVPGEGSTFVLSLPLFAGVVGSDARAHEQRDGAILVVEDDADCREVLCQVLESEGMRVVSAHDAPSALSALEASRPALVLLDLRLGDGDGRQVLQAIRHDPRLERTPVFVVSGASESAAGFRWDGPERIDGFFEKPLNLPRLLDRVQEIVRPVSAAKSS
ncbi:MAG TPA: hybrid sensor histidine kinase/response regulator [Myxococcales bacterium]|jgi:signal transduction histidine kinase/CheY-like chemotaxis protein